MAGWGLDVPPVPSQTRIQPQPRLVWPVGCASAGSAGLGRRVRGQLRRALEPLGRPSSPPQGTSFCCSPRPAPLLPGPAHTWRASFETVSAHLRDCELTHPTAPGPKSCDARGLKPGRGCRGWAGCGSPWAGPQRRGPQGARRCLGLEMALLCVALSNYLLQAIPSSRMSFLGKNV